jgi:hypothetical protein
MHVKDQLDTANEQNGNSGAWNNTKKKAKQKIDLALYPICRKQHHQKRNTRAKSREYHHLEFVGRALGYGAHYIGSFQYLSLLCHALLLFLAIIIHIIPNTSANVNKSQQKEMPRR